MRAFVITASAAALVAACASLPAPPPDGPVTTADGNDCAVIAAVAKEHYRFGPDNPPPPLWLDGEGSGWAPACDWARYGLSFPSTYDPDRPTETDGRVQWVSFKRPRYDGRGAVIETGILHGPLAGMGHECRVHSGFAGWTVGECRSTWIS